MQLTQSVWLLASLVNLQSAKVFQSLIPLSAPPETICLLSYEKAQVKISLVCPMNCLEVAHVLKSQSLKVLSHEEEIKKLLSVDRAKSEIKWLCPVMHFFGTP